MRLFAALPPPAEALDQLDRAITPWVGRVPGLRWPDRTSWHVTLAFFGEVPDGVLTDLAGRLASVAAEHAAMTLAFTGFGAFPHPRRARVFWAGVAADHSLSRLSAALRHAGRQAGAPWTDTKPFHPHLTLARARGERDLRPLVESLTSFRGSTWRATEVRLMRSMPVAPISSVSSVSPVEYRSLAAWTLG